MPYKQPQGPGTPSLGARAGGGARGAGRQLFKIGKLNLVDLAGSEQVVRQLGL